MRYTNFGNISEDLQLKEIPEICGELSQLESVMYLLDGLLGWCELCFNNEQEEKDYKLLVKAYDLLEEVYISYKTNY